MNDLINYLKKNPFKDEKGNVVLAQPPNWQAVLAFSLYVARIIINDNSFVTSAFYVALIFWAYEELVYGVNLFRRLLGAAVIVGVLASLSKL